MISLVFIIFSDRNLGAAKRQPNQFEGHFNLKEIYQNFVSLPRYAIPENCPMGTILIDKINSLFNRFTYLGRSLCRQICKEKTNKNLAGKFRPR